MMNRIGKNNRRSGGRGFSVLEITVVVMILGILSSFAIIQYSSYRKNAQMKNASKSLESVFSAARALAINQNKYYAVRIDIGDGSFWIDEINRQGYVQRAQVTGMAFLPEGVVFSDVVRRGVTWTTGSVGIQINPDSTADYSTVYLLGENSDASDLSAYTSVRIYSSTALVHIYENQRK